MRALATVGALLTLAVSVPAFSQTTNTPAYGTTGCSATNKTAFTPGNVTNIRPVNGTGPGWRFNFSYPLPSGTCGGNSFDDADVVLTGWKMHFEDAAQGICNLTVEVDKYS